MAAGGFVTQGKSIFCKPYSGSDGNTGLSMDNAVKTLTKALALATADKNDIVYLVAESNTAASTTDYQSTALDWNKDMVHLIGVNGGAMLGQRSRIGQTSSVKTIEDLFTVSADGCLIANVEVFQGVATSTATSPRAVVVTGTRNRFYNCQISGGGDTSMSDNTGCRSLALTGNASENIFQHCYIGLDTTLRVSAMACEIELVGTGGGTKPARNIFEDCVISSYTSYSSFVAIKSTYLDRFLLLKNCVIHAAQNATSSVSPTAAITNTTPNGCIYILGGGVFGYADVTAADDSATLVLTHGALAANIIDMGVAKATDVAA
ncbi:MAG: hypothetical protein EHM49_00945 [Deltaproteobacteria bacterium]|nr:MAG: hypothetical protein EHM49_00945 [Deltaproteobacteria bacterium]